MHEFKAFHPPEPAPSLVSLRLGGFRSHSLVLVMGLIGVFTARAETVVPDNFPEGAQVFPAQQLTDRLGGRSFKATLKDGSGWRLQFKDEYIFVNLSSGARDTGTWRIEDGKLCTEYQRFPSGCSEVRGSNKELFLKRSSTGEIVRLESND